MGHHHFFGAEATFATCCASNRTDGFGWAFALETRGRLASLQSRDGPLAL
jgi:hypothetical protein